MENVLTQHLEMTPGVADGKPRIPGRRITVQNIAIWHERMGLSVEEIASQYELSLADVFAALAYYHDHRKEIEDSIQADDAFIEKLRGRTNPLLKEKPRG